jgi:hypothetical protein
MSRKPISDPLDLIRPKHLPSPGTQPSLENKFIEHAFRITRRLPDDQTARMDPVLRHHLRLDPRKSPR